MHYSSEWWIFLAFLIIDSRVLALPWLSAKYVFVSVYLPIADPFMLKGNQKIEDVSIYSWEGRDANLLNLTDIQRISLLFVCCCIYWILVESKFLLWYAAGLTEQIKLDRYLHRHFRYYMREVRTVVYSQFLESYKSVTIEAMAKAFGVTVEFIDLWVFVYTFFV